MLWDNEKVGYINGHFYPKNVDIELNDFISAEIIYDFIEENK